MAEESGRIGSGVRLRGKLQGAGRVVVLGEVEGDLELKDDAILEAGSRLNGAIRAREVDVAGQVDGRIETGRLDVRASAVVGAEIVAQTLAVEDGAQVTGPVRMQLDLPADVDP